MYVILILQVFKCPEPEGVLRITIVEAKNLMQCDIGLFGRGQSDPYVVLAIGAKKFRSQTVKKTVNPVFGDSWESVVEIVKSQILDIEVWDQDQGKDDDFMGRARIPIQVGFRPGLINYIYPVIRSWRSAESQRCGSHWRTLPLARSS